MAIKNIRMRKKSGTEWDTLYPITKAANVELRSGETVQVELDTIFDKTATVIKNGMMSKEDKIKINGIAAGANNYVHPNDSLTRHITDAEKITFSDKYTRTEIDNKLSTLTTGLAWKNTVNSYAEIATAYPSPIDGWTVNVKDTDITYRYTGSTWVAISANSIPIATTTVDGKMSKEDKILISNTSTNLSNLTKDLNTYKGHVHTYSSITNRPLGDEGQVQFFAKDNSNDTNPGYTMMEAAIVENDNELLQAKEKETDFAEVFNTWKRFSHRSDGVQPSVPSELNAWVYNDDKNQVICTQNTDSIVGFVSNEKVENYLHEATLSSTNTDDDWIGLVIAFAVDANGVEHALTAHRCRSGFPYWLIKYNDATSSYIVASKPRLELDDINGEETNTPATAWAKVPNGTKVKIERYGDIIVANTTPFSGTEYDLTATLTVDLNSDPRLAIFKGPQRYGYAAQSQSESTFSNITFSGGINNSIYDVSKDVVWNYSSDGWVADSSRSIFKDIGVGRFTYSPSNNKLFYLNSAKEIRKINIEAIASENQSLDSPNLTGTPIAPTAAAGTSTAQIATTAFVQVAINNIAIPPSADISGKANLASPTFTGTPAAPTATAGTNTTQLATTAFVTTAMNNKTTITGNAGTATKLATARLIGGASFDGTANVVLTSASVGLGNVTNESKATMFANPVLTGIPVTPTAAAGTDTTQVASTAFVTTAIANKTSITGNSGTATKLQTARTIAGVSFDGSANISITAENVGAVPTARTVNGKPLSANITLSASDVSLGNVTNESKSTMFTSPALTGTPTSPTAFVGNNTTQIATTAFVTTAINDKKSITGNSATATKLETSRTISLTGQVRGSVSFDGSANASLATTIVLENRTTDPTSPVVGAVWLRTDL